MWSIRTISILLGLLILIYIYYFRKQKFTMHKYLHEMNRLQKIETSCEETWQSWCEIRFTMNSIILSHFEQTCMLLRYIFVEHLRTFCYMTFTSKVWNSSCTNYDKTLCENPCMSRFLKRYTNNLARKIQNQFVQKEQTASMLVSTLEISRRRNSYIELDMDPRVNAGLDPIPTLLPKKRQGNAAPAPAREIKELFNPARRIAGISLKISFLPAGVNGR